MRIKINFICIFRSGTIELIHFRSIILILIHFRSIILILLFIPQGQTKPDFLSQNFFRGSVLHDFTGEVIELNK